MEPFDRLEVAHPMALLFLPADGPSDGHGELDLTGRSRQSWTFPSTPRRRTGAIPPTRDGTKITEPNIAISADAIMRKNTRLLTSD
jgi:hypothetical protein